MQEEPRGRQSLALSKSTHAFSNREPDGQTRFSNRSWRERIGLKAQDKGLVFHNLMKNINFDTLHESFKVLDGSKALGVDRTSKKTYQQNLVTNLKDLEARVQSGRYRPKPKREVLIPKANGKTRPIAIASLEDKIVDKALGDILTLVYEPLFIKNSYGYRPRKSAHQAIEACFRSMEKGTRPHVLEIDFSKFFNTIAHDQLMKIVTKRIADKRFLSLIRRLLTSEVLHATG